MGWNVVVLGVSDDIGYGISASESYPNVYVFEYVCDLAYLWGNVCGQSIKKLYFFLNLLLYLQLNRTCLLQSTPLHS